MVTPPVPAPKISGVPQATPLGTVAVTGTTQGVEVVITPQGSGGLLADVLPGGGFCQDVPLMSGQKNTMSIYALGGNGRVSAPVMVSVTQDPKAPQPSNPYCSGIMTQCGKTEICGNGKDDDCNGETDQCDPACNKCVDDAYEPNDQPVLVPMLQPGSYKLQICPCHSDWFSFRVGDPLPDAGTMGGRIHVVAQFDNSQMNLDLALYVAGQGGVGVGNKVASSTGTTNSEEIDYTADMPGTFYLNAYVHNNKYGSGSYTLTVY